MAKLKDHTDTLIELYNNLTNIENLKDDVNFLESIKFKLNNGNKILSALFTLYIKDIPFTIVKGFIYNLEEFSKFEKCILEIPESIEEKYIYELLNDQININKLNKNKYELYIK